MHQNLCFLLFNEEAGKPIQNQVSEAKLFQRIFWPFKYLLHQNNTMLQVSKKFRA